MPTRQISKVIQHLRRAGLLQDAGKRTDGQLLESFISRQEAAALEELVRRHARMVWGVCCRILHNHHDAEDAFQATFLVLIRKAASIRSRAKVGNWLYGVAHQTALKARATRAKRHSRERPVTQMPEPAVKDQDLWNDLQPLLDQEVSRLPEKYRTVIVLCDLGRSTVREAARQLGCPEGTVASRVARARTMLAKRLAAKGVSLSGGALAAALSQEAVSASVPPAVLSATIQAVTQVAAGQAAAGVVSAHVAALSEGVVKAMLLTKLKTMTAVALLTGLVTLAGGVLSYQPTVEAQHGPAAKTGTPEPAQQQAEDEYIEAQGRIVKHPKTDDWEVELKIPAQSLARVLAAFDAFGTKAALDVDLLLVNQPTQTHRGKLAMDRIQDQADRKGSHVLAWVRLRGSDIPKESQLALEVIAGTEVHARIYCGVRGKPVTPPAPQKVASFEDFTGRLVDLQLKPGYLTEVQRPRKPIVFRFDMDERSYLRYQRLLTAKKVKGPGDPLGVRLLDEENFDRVGVLTYFEDKFNADTGTIGVYGVLPNADGLLRPGMFVRVRMTFGPPPKASGPMSRDARDPLQGRWTFVSFEVDGRKVPEEPGFMTMTFEGDRFVRNYKLKENYISGVYTSTIDAGQRSGHLDLLLADGPIEGRIKKLLYEIDGDTLRIAQTQNDVTRRPKSFTDKDAGVITWKRAQPANPPTAVQGTWHVSALELEGKRALIHNRRLTVSADKIIIEDAFAPPKKEYRYVLHPEATPQQIDLIHPFGVKEGKVIKGIYLLEGDRLYLCLNYADNGDRPAKFAAEAGTKVELMLLEREKKDPADPSQAPDAKDKTSIDPNAPPENGGKGGAGELKIKALLKERHAALKEIASAITKRHQDGLASFAEVHEGNQAKHRAELDLRDTDKDRVVVLEKMLAEAKAFEKYAEAAHQRGKGTASAALKAKVERLEIEITLERAKAGGPGK